MKRIHYKKRERGGGEDVWKNDCHQSPKKGKNNMKRNTFVMLGF